MSFAVASFAIVGYMVAASTLAGFVTVLPDEGGFSSEVWLRGWSSPEPFW